jgi:aspartyl/glutamyl-tRNA(Asn/Gln) amidotransferase C subunit
MTTRITSQSVQKVANLARLHSQSEEGFVVHFQQELDAILSYVDELNTVTSSSTKVVHRTTTLSQLREDKPVDNEIAYKAVRDAIIANFPTSQGDLLILPGIFHDN